MPSSRAFAAPKNGVMPTPHTPRPKHRPAAAEDDAALMQALCSSDLSALGQIYDRYARDVRQLALRLTGAPAAAEDITQETFLALVDAAPRYTPTLALRSFLLGIASKLVLRARRRGAIGRRIIGGLAKAKHWVDKRGPERMAAANEEIARYQAALATLSPAKRVVVILTDVEQLKAREVAEALGIPIGTVWTRLHNGRKALRAELGWDVPAVG